MMKSLTVKTGWLLFAIICGICIAALPVHLMAQGNDQQNTPAVGNNEAVESDIPLAPEEKPKEEKKFSYNPHGMRDPFVSLLIANPMEARGEGVAGLKISELTLQGIQMGLGKIAIVLGADGNTYSLKVGDSVYDGKVMKITENKVVFEKIIFDAFGREKEKKSIEIYLHRG